MFRHITKTRRPIIYPIGKIIAHDSRYLGRYASEITGQYIIMIAKEKVYIELSYIKNSKLFMEAHYFFKKSSIKILEKKSKEL